MVRLFVRHRVDNYMAWKQAYDAFTPERAGMGVIDHAVYTAVGDDTDVTVTHDFATLSDGQAFMGSARIREVMEAAGVTGEPDVWFTNPG